MFLLDRTPDPHAAALIARMTVPPSDNRADLINRTIRQLKDAHLFHKMDCLFVLAAHNAQAALLDWKGGTYTATETNSPTFTVDRGYTFNGSSSYLDTTYNPTSAAGQYALNSSHIAAFNLTNSQDAGACVGTTNGGMGFITPRTATNTFVCRLNAGANDSVASVTNGTGHLLASRTSSTAFNAYRYGSSIGSFSRTSTSIPNGTFSIGRATTSYGAHQIAAAHWGAGLSADDAARVSKIISNYMSELGAI